MSLKEIVVVQHSHTDLGFTHDPVVVWELHGRFLEEALDVAERYADGREGERFCWTVEVCGVLEPWLKRAKSRDVERMVKLERAGLIEVMALPFHLTPLADVDELREAMEPARRLRKDLGLTIDSAMTSDVNGQPWPLVDVLIDEGVKGYSSALNVHFGRAPLARPGMFAWEGPSGRVLPAYNGLHYGSAERMGMGSKDFEALEKVWLPRMEEHLAKVGYTWPVLMLQSVDAFGDNGPTATRTLEFVRRWNAAGKSPRITFGTPRTFWKKAEVWARELKVVRGDWTDFWNFGCLSTARDLSASRRNRVRLRQADAIAEALAKAGRAVPETFGRFRREASWRQMVWQEHTWTADCAAEAPHSEDAVGMSAQKSALVHSTRGMSYLLRRDALIALAAAEEKKAGKDDVVLVTNTLAWDRVVAGPVTAGVSFLRGRPDDLLASAHYQDRKDDIEVLDMEEVPDSLWKPRSYPSQALLPVNVPAKSSVWVPRTKLVSADALSESAAREVETEFFRVRVDTQRGGVVSLVDKRAGREWVDQTAPWRLNHWVEERVLPTGKQPCARDEVFQMNWASPTVESPNGWRRGFPVERKGVECVTSHRVVTSALGTHIIQWLPLGLTVRGLRQEVFLPAHADWIEFRSRWLMPADPHPHAHYLVFPFALDGAQARVDLGGVEMRPGPDQVPGSCHDYFTVQNWVDLSNAEAGVTVAVPENPMVQFGGFRFGEAAEEFELKKPWVMGWATANYWHCNFPAMQPGWVKSRYRVRFHGAFDEEAAHRFGHEAAEERPLVHAVAPRDAEAVKNVSATPLDDSAGRKGRTLFGQG